MGIKDEDSIMRGESVAQPGEYPRPNPQANPQSGPSASGPAPEMSPMNWFMTNTDGNPLGSVISSSMGGEITNNLKNSLVEIFKNVPKNVQVSVIPFDREQVSGFYFSCIAVAVSFAGTKRVAFYALILEGTNSPIPPVNSALYNGGSVEITRLASNAADNELYRRIKESLQKKFPENEVIAVDSCVVPRDFDIKDQDQVRRIAAMATLACGNELTTTAPNFKDINIQDLARYAGRSLNILINYGRTSKFDQVGNPVRSDVRCVFKASSPTKNNDLAVNTPETSTLLAEVNGFIDVVYVGGNEVNPYMPQQQVKLDNYAARMVITDLDRLNGYTIPNMLLALSTVSVLSRDNYWMLAFRPQSQNRDAVDITDIGALGYELDFTHNPETAYKKIETKSDSFDTSMLARYLTTILKPKIIVSMDIPDAGPQTWYSRIFAAGTRGTVAALRKIVLAANQLTNGSFPANYDINNIFIDTNNRVHLGHYFNKDGQKRDIREIDYISVANIYGEKDKQKIVDWSDTFTRTSVNIDIRLAERKKMIQMITDGHCEFTGYAERVTFSGAFLETLVSSIVAAGLHVNLIPPLSTENFNAVRSGAPYQDAAFSGGATYAMPTVSSAGTPTPGMASYIDSRF